MTKHKAAPAAINTPAPVPTPGDRIRYFVGQLMTRAAQPDQDGNPDLELGGLAVALDMVAGDVERELAALAFERDLAVAHDRQPYPTPWAYEQAAKAARKHHDRADTAEAALSRVREVHEEGFALCTGCKQPWPCPTIRALDGTEGSSR